MKLPNKMKMRGRPKGSGETNVIGLRTKRGAKPHSKPLPFFKLPLVEQEKSKTLIISIK